MINQRIRTFATKYLKRQELFQSDQVIPLWVADMDLPGSPAISQALIDRAQHTIYGYTSLPDDYFDAYIGWQLRRNQHTVERHMMAYCDNLVQGIQWVLASLLEPGDKVVVQPPVYFPFFRTIKNNNLIQVDNPLMEDQGYYTMNLAELDELMADAKAFILCNPHNPVGRLWTRSELEQLVALAEKHDCYILSDEIHSDLIHQGRFIPAASINDTATKRVITFNSTGKSFNTAGLHGGYVIFPNQELKAAYETYANSQSASGPNCFNVIASIAAYNDSEAWFDDTLHTIQDNIQRVVDRFQRDLPQVKVRYPEATYLLWLDFRSYGLSDEELLKKCTAAGVGLGPGVWFGTGGSGHMRLNCATPWELLELALDQLIAEFREA